MLFYILYALMQVYICSALTEPFMPDIWSYIQVLVFLRVADDWRGFRMSLLNSDAMIRPGNRDKKDRRARLSENRWSDRKQEMGRHQTISSTRLHLLINLRVFIPTHSLSQTCTVYICKKLLNINQETNYVWSPSVHIQQLSSLHNNGGVISWCVDYVSKYVCG